MWIDDQIFARCAEAMAIEIFVPQETMVVLGNANEPDVECRTDRCEADKVPVLKRRGGGGAVVLHDGCVVVSLGTWVRSYYDNALYFKSIVKALADALSETWPHLDGLGMAGISDLAMGDRKVGGTSLFRSKNYLLFQASILVSARADLMDAYLAHPSREPEYRQKKPHTLFVAGLDQWVPNLVPQCLVGTLSTILPAGLQRALASEHVDPVPDQIEAVKCKGWQISRSGLN